MLPPTRTATAAPAATHRESGPLVGDLRVVFHAGRVGAEDEPILLIQIGVQDDLEAVGVPQGRIAAAVCHDDGLRIPDVADHPEVQRVVGVDDPDLGAFRRRLPLVRPVLTKAGGGRHLRVGRIVEDLAIHDGGVLDPPRAGERETRSGERAHYRVDFGRGLLGLRDARMHKASKNRDDQEASHRDQRLHKATSDERTF